MVAPPMPQIVEDSGPPESLSVATPTTEASS
jgi:hypothetical protein